MQNSEWTNLFGYSAVSSARAAVFVRGSVAGRDTNLCRLSSTINPFMTKLYMSELKNQFVPRSKHSALVIKTDVIAI